MLSYKAEMVGIKVIVTEESYTSKASFLDNDYLPVYKKDQKNQVTFSGKRVKSECVILNRIQNYALKTEVCIAFDYIFINYEGIDDCRPKAHKLMRSYK